MNRWLPLLLLAAMIPCAQAHDALQVIDDCVSRLDPGTDVGYARIAHRCPDLAPTLLQDPASAWLPADWNRPDNQLSARGLSELRVLLAQERQPSVSRRATPSVDRVGSVLAALVTTEQARGGWWTRLKQWLRRLLTPRHPDGDEDTWLRRWLAAVTLSAGAGELIAWTALALLVVLAAAILINELRVARLSGQRARRPHAARTGTDVRRQWSLEAIAGAESWEQPGLLLDFIATRLAEEERLPPARAFTARELTERAQLPDAHARASLAELGAVSDRVRFSGAAVPVERLSAALAGGRRLLASLEGASARGRTSAHA